MRRARCIGRGRSYVDVRMGRRDQETCYKAIDRRLSNANNGATPNNAELCAEGTSRSGLRITHVIGAVAALYRDTSY